ncbi:MAG: hypothetical protein JSR46_02500 [Verrucomicrobia bacterium]|nr:hypothetical protein [Verrucomicrobiota bacterium]
MCPCHSQIAYAECCKPFHDRTRLPENASLLMRSRYSAYALGLVDYIIQTTHPTNPLFTKSPLEIRKEIFYFCEETQFTGLEILNFTDGETKAYVTFVAHLIQGGKKIRFTEKSLFLKQEKQWLYAQKC